MKLGISVRRRTRARLGRDFALFWTAQAASATGDQIREFTLPIVAITVLQVSAGELGLLAAMQWVPFLLFALPLGVIVDRHRRRRMLLLSETGRGILAAGLAVLAVAGALAYPVLLVGAAALGVLTVVYEVGYQSAIPMLVRRDQLAAANARMQATAAAAQVGGPGVGGLLVQLAGATAALAVTAGSHLASAVALLSMRSAEPAPEGSRRPFLVELRDGANHVLRDPLLRANVGFSALYNPFAQWVTLLLALYAVGTLGLTAGQVGLVFSAGAAGAVVGASWATRAAVRSRVGAVIMLCAAVECAALLAIPVVDPSWGAALAISTLAALMAVNGAGTALSSVLLITIRQVRTPHAMLGRVNATMRTVTYGTVPLGAVAGGVAGEALGARGGLSIGAVLCLGTVVWVWLSPLRRISRMEELAPAEPLQDQESEGEDATAASKSSSTSA